MSVPYVTGGVVVTLVASSISVSDLYHGSYDGVYPYLVKICHVFTSGMEGEDVEQQETSLERLTEVI